MKYTVIVRPASVVEIEFEAEIPEGASKETIQQVSDDARARWYEEEAMSVPLTVSIQPMEWAEEGLYGTGESSRETEAEMLARMQREAEEQFNLPPDR